MKREAGYYWVKYDDKWTCAEWCIFYEKTFVWFIVGSESPMNDLDFKQINEQRINTPDEPILEFNIEAHSQTSPEIIINEKK